MSWMYRKPAFAIAAPGGTPLPRTLSWWHLVALGVGAIVGTGIYTLVGSAAAMAGPGMMLSFAIAGTVCACAALAYAEVATMIPSSGSSYTYSYVVIGEAVAWVVGWSLILEYSLVVSAVAVTWSGYAQGLLISLGTPLPAVLVAGPAAGGLVNLPAIAIVMAVAALLVAGTRESASLNAVLVVIKIAALLLFVAVALPYFDVANFHPFMPEGFAKHEVGGEAKGVMAAAALIFFAFYGFDAISTSAEEVKRPDRDLPIGIIGSMLVCTLIYVGVAAAAIGAVPTARFSNSVEPLALILRELGSNRTAGAIAAVAVIALPTVILAFFFGQSRIFFTMARDGMLPATLARVSPKNGTPIRITVLTAAVTGVLAGLVPLNAIAALANAGTLCAFVAVSACMLILRRRSPEAPRAFRTPAAWLVGPLAIAGCLYLFFSLSQQTQLFFLGWNVLGLIVYLLRRPYVIRAT